ncbi:UbiX family flavin prenyltransferase [Campylobacter geochelonis]|uniref:Phenylacrylic acid decarboxylase (PAD) n=1 Tax=Campylobacter geochelonis TaxID=1780362 RepID=A0A128EI85_9BACT|nr:UbiX family flavin prenyltransferase [Campylobacter geochelonis]QKF71302.1 3-octaprenyl-4-hydroxybenzoate carboxy-lyase [Campylobacter geochelonis]CZE48082.1 phenylacrylic acid decarboxylase (PAD) [Campylobacter geochelonis]CZE48176.1 phenylacrylic acid decarboxylase (PAD) [Campylobacter geochelonis]CZE51079.1 phenylacrylic acid decarboxylase (PAD) [Campylobacter geochelonis]
MKILLCITGASLLNLAIKLIDEISKENELYVIFSKNAKLVLKAENKLVFNQAKFKNITFLDDENIAACVASGSFGIEKTIVAPCSINTLAKISNSIADTLITRACAVALKEQKKLILGVREMPFSAISLRQMSELASLGVAIAPPVMASYAGQSLEEIENFIVGKWLDLLGIENKIYKRWK